METFKFVLGLITLVLLTYQSFKFAATGETENGLWCIILWLVYQEWTVI